MTGYITFEGRIEPLVWGKATYAILRLPEEVTKALRQANGVEGEIADHPVNLAPTLAPVVEGAFLWAGKSLSARIGVEPGALMEVRLRPADPREVDLAGDIETALRAGQVIDAWQALTPGKRRGHLYQVEVAKTLGTRAKRIAALSKMFASGS